MEVSENGVVFAGRLGWIQNTFEAFQDYLKNPVKVVRLTEKLVVVMQQESVENAPLNRALVKDGNIVEIYTVNLICIRQNESGFHSIQEEDVGVIRKILKPVFYLDGQIIKTVFYFAEDTGSDFNTF